MIYKSTSTTAQRAKELVEPIVKREGLEIWDVRFEKEGAAWYLKVFLEKADNYILTEDCERVSRELSSLLDEYNFIEQSYFLEVSSPGIERELTKPAHFEKYVGEMIRVKTIRPINVEREFSGVLLNATKESLKIEYKDSCLEIGSDKVSKVQVFFEF